MVVLSRAPRPTASETGSVRRSQTGTVAWDGRLLGAWANEMDGCDVVINLAGRTVNCRYTPANLKEMMDSRVLSTRAVGQAIGAAKSPPRVYSDEHGHRIRAPFDAANDDISGQIGGDEPDVPAYWKNSVDIALAWEAAQAEASTPGTRQVACTAMVMSREAGSIFDVLSRLVRFRLGGPVGAGNGMYLGFTANFVEPLSFWLKLRLSGPVNLAAPNPLTFRPSCVPFARPMAFASGCQLLSGWPRWGPSCCDRYRAAFEEPPGCSASTSGCRLCVTAPRVASGSGASLIGRAVSKRACTSKNAAHIRDK